MLINKKCLICGNEFQIPHWRDKTAKYCSKECQRKSLRAKPNLVCPICGKMFHRKQYHINRCKGDFGFCCSKECDRQLRRVRMTGRGNHQYGLKGELNSSFINRDLIGNNNNLKDVLVFVGCWYKHYNENGRITKHRYLVELNHELFDSFYFEEIDGWFYLKKGYEVHHKDCNHNNNEIENLQILSKGEHRRLHNKLKIKRKNGTE